MIFKDFIFRKEIDLSDKDYLYPFSKKTEKKIYDYLIKKYKKEILILGYEIDVDGNVDVDWRYN